MARISVALGYRLRCWHNVNHSATPRVGEYSHTALTEDHHIVSVMTVYGRCVVLSWLYM